MNKLIKSKKGMLLYYLTIPGFFLGLLLFYLGTLNTIQIDADGDFVGQKELLLIQKTQEAQKIEIFIEQAAKQIEQIARSQQRR